MFQLYKLNFEPKFKDVNALSLLLCCLLYFVV